MSKVEDSGGVKGHVRRCFGTGLAWRAVNCDNLSQSLLRELILYWLRYNERADAGRGALGGFSVVMLMTTMGAVALAVLTAVGLALIAFVAATVVSIVFACRTKRRRAEGKKLKGLIAIPVVLYAVSIPVLVWFALTFVAPLVHEAATSDYDDCSVAIVTHEPEKLEVHLEAAGGGIPLEGAKSWESLLRVSIEYGDAECAEVVIETASELDVPLDLDAPLADYGTDGEPFAEVPALLLAVGDEYSSPDMVEVLLSHGADPDITLSKAHATSSSGAETSDGSATALHLACAGVGGSWLYADSDLDGGGELLSQTDEVIDLLVESGASLDVRDGEGLTPWEIYQSLMDNMQQSGSLTAKQAREILDERSTVLKP